MENNSIAKLLLGFIVLIVGVSLIGTIAHQTNESVDLLGIANESFATGVAGEGMIADPCLSVNTTHPYTIANAPTSGWQAQGGCPITSFVVRNQTGDTATVTIDYVFYANNGTFYLLNTTTNRAADCTVDPTNVTVVDYTYCPDDYLDSGWGRSVLTMVSGFFALALLGAAVGLFYSVAKDAGILAN